MKTLTWPRRAFIGVLAALAAAGVLGVAASPASAHEPTATLISVARSDSIITLDARIPLDRYDFAYDTDLADDPDAAVAAAELELVAQLEEAVSVSSDGTAWDVEVGGLETSEVNGVPNLAVELVATPPSGLASGPVDLRWTFVTDTLFSHKVYVVLAQDAESVIASPTVDAANILGLITTQSPALTISPHGPSTTSTFTTLFTVGFDHFREGPDHLLFLALVALGVARRRRGWVSSVRGLAVLTAAFTVGHSVSLAAATVGWVSLPSGLIETGIAVTILAAAVHAVRPTLTPGVELVVTGLFGLVHGCGFAGTLSDLAVRGAGAIVPLLGFNVGLEAAQLLGLLLIAAPLMVLGRSTTAAAVFAAAIGAVALGWIGQRALGWADPFAPVVALVAGSPERLALILAAAAAVMLVVRGRRIGESAAALPGDDARPRRERSARLSHSN